MLGMQGLVDMWTHSLAFSRLKNCYTSWKALYRVWRKRDSNCLVVLVHWKCEVYAVWKFTLLKWRKFGGSFLQDKLRDALWPPQIIHMTKVLWNFTAILIVLYVVNRYEQKQLHVNLCFSPACFFTSYLSCVVFQAASTYTERPCKAVKCKRYWVTSII